MFTTLGCLGCHSVDGTKRIGPSVLHLYGQSVRLTNGSTQIRTDAYFRQQILFPEQLRIFGYPPIMPGYNGRIQESELQALLAYLRSLSPPKTTNSPNTPPKPTSPHSKTAVASPSSSLSSHPSISSVSAKASPQTPPIDLRRPTAKTLALGRHYYHLHCSFCHGVEGRGDGPGGRGHEFAVKNFARGEFLYGRDPEILYNIISHGSQRTAIMPAWEHLPPAIRWSLVAYLQSLSSANTPSTRP